MQTVLVVDDSAIDLMMTKTLLEKLGFEPLTAANGRDALNLITKSPPNFVICDINMPGMNGLELLKATRHFKQPPVFIMATSINDAEHAVASLQHGAYGYITKPVKEESLNEALRKATLRRQRELDAGQGNEKLPKTGLIAGMLTHDETAVSIAASYGDRGAIIITVGDMGVRMGVGGLTPQQVRDALCVAIKHNLDADPDTPS